MSENKGQSKPQTPAPTGNTGTKGGPTGNTGTRDGSSGSKKGK
jgi:hypothetical protein